MKKISLVLIVLLSTILVFGASAQHCNHAHQSGDMEKDGEQAKTGTVVQEFQKQLAEVYKANLKLNEALVASDKNKSANAAKNVKETLKKVDMALLKGQDHRDWMSYLQHMNESLVGIEGGQNLESQRKAFSDFSNALYKSVKQYGIDGQTAYYQYCPMALNNKGAYWISGIKEIQNPYFGSSMLKCGSTKETL